jgi:hypothetical protein
MKCKPTPLTFTFSILLLASLACTIFVGGPEYPDQTIPASEGEVTAMKTQIEQALLQGVRTGVVTLQFTENQLTSYFTLKLQSLTNPPFTDPQVLLRDGQMQIYGRVSSGVFTANMYLAMDVSIDQETGLPVLSISTADFGPIPAPEGLNAAISAIIDEAFTGSFGPVATGIRIETISIEGGIMTLIGRIK